MKPLKKTLIYGLLFILPIAIVSVLVLQLVQYLEKINGMLGIQTFSGGMLAVAAALLIVFAVLYAVGLAVQTRLGSLTQATIEKRIVKFFPGYSIVSNILKGFSDDMNAYPPAAVELYGEGIRSIAFIMEENPDGTLTLFVPATPAITIGNIVVADAGRVTRLDASAKSTAEWLAQWGISHEDAAYPIANIASSHPGKTK